MYALNTHISIYTLYVKSKLFSEISNSLDLIYSFFLVKYLIYSRDLRRLYVKGTGPKFVI